MPAVMDDLIRETHAQILINNDQRHDAALTIAERAGYEKDLTRHLLLMVGLAAIDEDGVVGPAGEDEWELSWFTPAAGRAVSRGR